MTRSQRISKLARLSRNKEREAARQLSDAQEALTATREKLTLMMNYRKEYMSLLEPNGNRINVRQVQERQAFILQMDESITLLKNQIEMQENMTRQEMQKWMQAKRYIETMENISERFAMAERRISELKEQHEIDGLSTSKWHANHHA